MSKEQDYLKEKIPSEDLRNQAASSTSEEVISIIILANLPQRPTRFKPEMINGRWKLTIKEPLWLGAARSFIGQAKLANIEAVARLPLVSKISPNRILKRGF